MNRRALVAYSYMIGGLSFFITGFLILLNYTLNSDLKYVDNNSAKLATFRRANFTELLIVASSPPANNNPSGGSSEVYFYSLCQVNFEFESTTSTTSSNGGGGSSSGALSIKDEVLSKNALLKLHRHRRHLRQLRRSKRSSSGTVVEKKGSFRIGKISTSGGSGYGSSKLQQIRVVKSVLVRKLLHLVICSSEKLYLALVSLLSVCGSFILLVGCVKFYQYDSEQNGMSGSANGGTSLLQKFNLVYRVCLFFHLVRKRESRTGGGDSIQQQQHQPLKTEANNNESEYTDLNLARRSLAAERMCPFVYEELPAFMMNNNSSFFLTKDESKSANDRPEEIVNMPPLPPLVIANTNSLIATFEIPDNTNKKKNTKSKHNKQSSLSPKLPSSQPPTLKQTANNNTNTLPVRKSNEDTATKYNTLSVSGGGGHTVRFKSIVSDEYQTSTGGGGGGDSTPSSNTTTTAQVAATADRLSRNHKQQATRGVNMTLTSNNNAFSNNNYETFEEIVGGEQQQQQQQGAIRANTDEDAAHSVVISSRPPVATGSLLPHHSNQSMRNNHHPVSKRNSQMVNTQNRLSTVGGRRSRHQSMLCDDLTTINDSTCIPITSTTTTTNSVVFASSLSQQPQDPTMPKILLASRVVNVNTESLVNSNGQHNSTATHGIAPPPPSSSSTHYHHHHQQAVKSSGDGGSGKKLSYTTTTTSSSSSSSNSGGASHQPTSSNDAESQIVKHFL